MSPRRPEDRATPPSPDSVEAALTRAAEHGRKAASEALLAARALLDALSLSLHGAGAAERRVLGLVGRGLEDLAEALAGGPSRTGLLRAVAEALDVEIARWEQRARQDVDARAVLRAYLGLREILWELGVRPAEAGDAPAEGAATSGSGRGPARRGSGRGGGIRRVPVEG